MLLTTAALGGILLAAGTAEPGYSPYASAAHYGPATQSVAAGQYAPEGQYAPAAPIAAPREYPTYPAQPWSGSAVRQAAFEEPASPQDAAVRRGSPAVRRGSPDPAGAPARDVSRDVARSGDRATTGAAADRGAAPLPLTPPGGRSSIPLAPPGESSQPGAQDRGAGPTSVVTVLGALGLVLGIFLLTAWGIRRAAPQGLHPLPNEVFEVLGRAPLAGRQQAHLLRLGNKLVLVSLSPAGAETLTEITDPLEVDRVAGLCRQAQPGSATAVFRQVLDQFAPRRPSAGEVGRTSSPSYKNPDVGRTGSPSYESPPYGPAERRHG